MPVLHISRLSALLERLRQRSEPCATPDEPEWNDIMNDHASTDPTSYENALFDSRMHAFFQSEYGSAEPSPTVQANLMRAIQLHQEEQRHQQYGGSSPVFKLKTSYLRCKELLAALYTFGSKADTSRIVTGGVVAVLLALIVTPQMSHLLRGGPSDYMTNAYPEYWHLNPGNLPRIRTYRQQITRNTAPALVLMELKTGESLSDPGTYVPLEAPSLHPVELTRGKIPPQAPQDILPTGNGPQ